MSERVPWYGVIEGPSLAQGDFIGRCPVFLPPPDLDLAAFDAGQLTNVEMDWRPYDVVIVTQSCDLEQEKVDQVLVCPHFSLSTLSDQHPFFRSSRGKEELRRGNVIGYHMLASCDLSGFEAEIRVVELRTVFTIPRLSLQSVAVVRGKRIRLYSPYREHLAQAFARFIMRVGLPVDIPPFKGS